MEIERFSPALLSNPVAKLDSMATRLCTFATNGSFPRIADIQIGGGAAFPASATSMEVCGLANVGSNAPGVTGLV